MKMIVAFPESVQAQMSPLRRHLCVLSRGTVLGVIAKWSEKL